MLDLYSADFDMYIHAQTSEPRPQAPTVSTFGPVVCIPLHVSKQCQLCSAHPVLIQVKETESSNFIGLLPDQMST